MHFAIIGGETELHQANNYSGDAQLTTINSVKASAVQFNYLTDDEIDRYFKNHQPASQRIYVNSHLLPDLSFYFKLSDPNRFA